jgi:hypothetical protein
LGPKDGLEEASNKNDMSRERSVNHIYDKFEEVGIGWRSRTVYKDDYHLIWDSSAAQLKMCSCVAPMSLQQGHVADYLLSFGVKCDLSTLALSMHIPVDGFECCYQPWVAHEQVDYSQMVVLMV